MRRSMLLAAALALPGCLADIGGPDEPDLIDVESTFTNGPHLNGPQLNGRYLNGRYLNGVELNGRYLNGRYLNGLTLQGSELIGNLDGSSLSGSQLVGVELAGTLDDGSSIRLLIEAARTLPRPNTDVWAYTIAFDDGGAWGSVCGYDGSGNPVEAIALAGRWDTRQGVEGGGDWIDEPGVFSLGCRGTGATAKCVEIGYKPWTAHSTCIGKGKTRTCTSTPLRPYHQACTRLARADFCGDGNSWTFNGNTINLYDRLGIQSDEFPLVVEAEWSPDGATCFTPYHADQVSPGRDPTGHCAAIPESATCGSFESGILVSETFVQPPEQ